GTRFQAGERAGAYLLHPGRRADYDALLALLRAGGELPDRVVHLWGVSGGLPRLPGAAGLDAALEHGFGSLLCLAQALGAVCEAEGRQAELTVVCDHLESVTGGETVWPEKATLLGPCRTIPLEYPGISCRAIDVALPTAGASGEALARLVDNLLGELDGGAGEPQGALGGERRWRGGCEPLRLEPEAAGRARLRDGGVYLITGGLGGIGLAVAEDLAQAVRARLVLVGRSALPPEEDWPELLEAGGGPARAIRQVQQL